MASKTKKRIYDIVYKRHLRLYRDLNDIYIFATKTIPLLNEAAMEFKNNYKNWNNEDVPFIVPGKSDSSGKARRSNQELHSLFMRFASRELYENLIVSTVSRFEIFLSDIIRAFLHKFPEKLSVGIKGGDSHKNLSLQMVLDAGSMETLIDRIIELRLQSVFYAEPKDYCSYINAISEIGISEDLLSAFFEIKATRDLIVHNSLVVNDMYLKKAGERKRGNIGEKLKITKIYFEESISIMKTLSGTIERKTREKFTNKTLDLDFEISV